MGGKESTTRKVSYGLDEEENVTVLQGIKLSDDVLQRMRERSQTPERPPSPKPDSQTPDPGPATPPMSAVQEALRKRYEQEQDLLRNELGRIARREREAVGDDLTSTVLRERARTSEELEKVQNLARQLARKDSELRHLAAFYKEQLQLMEKKNMDHYQQTSQMYSRAAEKAETSVQLKHTVPICPSLESQVLSCYKENRHQTLHCSALAKQYINCINSAKKNLMVSDAS